MATNKVVVNNQTLIDLTSDTVTAETLIQGYTAHGANGELITGTATQGGASSEPPKDVNFYDYDGTIVYSYTAAEFAALTAMPSNPNHTGLTAQGWNWTLSNAKAHVANNKKLNIGQMYITDDGKTRAYISIPAPGRMTIPITFTQTISNGVVIDWGDGSSAQTVSGTGAVSAAHTYSDIGDYVITLAPIQNCAVMLGDGQYTFLGAFDINSFNVSALVYVSMLKKLEIGSWVTAINISAFLDAFGMKTITIPLGLSEIGSGAFEYSCLSSIIIPSSVTSIGEAAFAYMPISNIVVLPLSITIIGSGVFEGSYLSSIIIPSSVTTIGNRAFTGQYTLSSIIIPLSVTAINNYAFSECYSVAEYHIKPPTPPTLGNHAFDGIAEDCIIYVPSGSINAYKTATNWSNYASMMVGE